MTQTPDRNSEPAAPDSKRTAARRFAAALVPARHDRPLPAQRTRGLTTAMTLLGAVLLVLTMRLPQGPTDLRAAALIALAFAVAEVFVFHVEIRDEAHTFTLSEIPFVAGLLFLNPIALIVSRLVGEAIVLVGRERQSLVKLTFNLALFFAETSVATAVFSLLATDDISSAVTWLAVAAAVLVADGIGVLALVTVVRWHGGHLEPLRLITIGYSTAVLNISLALVSSVALSQSWIGIVPLSVIAIGAFIGYRGYTALSRRHHSLGLLYDFTRLVGGSLPPDEIVERMLHHARELLDASHTEIVLFGQDGGRDHYFVVSEVATAARFETVRAATVPLIKERVIDGGNVLLIPRSTRNEAERETLERIAARDCVIGPVLSGDSVIGLLLAADRFSDVSTFDHDDAPVFETLVRHASVALENGRLIDRLGEQVRMREHQATHDPLTLLPNRSLFLQRLEQAVKATLADKRQSAVLLLDLDGFKEVNDTLGHETGDRLLQEVATRLDNEAADGVTVARLGGDEFALVLPQVAGPAGAMAAAEQFRRALMQPMMLSGVAIDIRGSIGVAVCPEHGDLPATLLRHADVAMYASKSSADRRPQLYAKELDQNSRRRLSIAAALETAIANNELDVYYQPKARLSDGEIVSVEALARWTHAEFGTIAPDEFIAIAERTGLIAPLTDVVLARALAQHRRWAELGLHVDVAVNVSARTLVDRELPVRVERAIAAAGVDPANLTIEITESSMMSDPGRTNVTIAELAALGVSLSVDDFGTGYSSLGHLRVLPVAELKIDRSFVLPLNMDPGARSIVKSIIELAHNMDLHVVAEGVEDQLTWDALRVLKCDLAQGYHLSRPLPSDRLTAWLLDRQALTASS